jgi:molybdenum cofactor cytidylyltransferase
VLRDGGASRAFIVVGGDAAAVKMSLPASDPFVRIVENSDFEQGQLSSLLAGIAAVEQDDPDTLGVMMTLVDLPLIGASTVRAVLDAFRRSPSSPLVRPRRGTRYGHPVIFGRRLFAEFRTADPTQGAKPVVRAHASEELTVPVEDDGSFADVDTPDDYERLVRPTLAVAPASRGSID